MTDFPVWRAVMDKAALKAHQAWLASGKAGPGRLVLEDRNLAGAQTAQMFPGARFVRCDLSKASFPIFKLDELELVACKLDDANLQQTHLERAIIDSTTFTRANLRVADFSHATIRGGSFAGADLERAFFVGATLEGVDFAGARLVDAVFDDARLIDCNLRGCDLSRADRALDLARTTRTRFERCDLRETRFDGRRLDGAVFDGCQMSGIHGTPEIRGPYAIESPAGAAPPTWPTS